MYVSQGQRLCLKILRLYVNTCVIKVGQNMKYSPLHISHLSNLALRNVNDMKRNKTMSAPCVINVMLKQQL